MQEKCYFTSNNHILIFQMSDSKIESSAAAAEKDVLVPPPAGGAASVRRRQSFAQGDMLKYRRSFDLFDIEKNGRVSTSKLPDIIKRLGYRLNKEKIQVVNLLINYDVV